MKDIKKSDNKAADFFTFLGTDEKVRARRFDILKKLRFEDKPFVEALLKDWPSIIK